MRISHSLEFVFELLPNFCHLCLTLFPWLSNSFYRLASKDLGFPMIPSFLWSSDICPHHRTCWNRMLWSLLSVLEGKNYKKVNIKICIVYRLVIKDSKELDLFVDYYFFFLTLCFNYFLHDFWSLNYLAYIYYELLGLYLLTNILILWEI